MGLHRNYSTQLLENGSTHEKLRLISFLESAQIVVSDYFKMTFD